MTMPPAAAAYSTALARDVLRIAEREVVAENDRLRAALTLVLDRAVEVREAEAWPSDAVLSGESGLCCFCKRPGTKTSDPDEAARLYLRDHESPVRFHGPCLDAHRAKAGDASPAPAVAWSIHLGRGEMAHARAALGTAATFAGPAP